MSDDLWGEEPFSDIPDEVDLDANGQPMSSPPAMIQRTVVPPSRQPPKVPLEVEEDFTEEILANDELARDGLTEEEDFSDVLIDANLRLEQGNLWKLIMKHDLFEGVDADPKAIQNVQRVIRKFAKEQMEIMLGMRKETTQTETLHIDFPFNNVEIEVLKMIAHKASGGMSEHSENYVPAITKVTEEVPVAPKRQVLNPIGTKKAPAASRPVVPKPKAPLQKPVAPVKRTRLDVTIDQIAREEGISREILERELKVKPAHEMDDAEKAEHNRTVTKRMAIQAKSTEALPMPTFEQEQALAEQHIRNVPATSSGFSQLTRLIEAAKAMPIKSK